LAHPYEAWEHRQLGDALGGEGRRIRLPNGVELTYGQVVALSGDFYRSPEALLKAPEAELKKILSIMNQERALAAASPTHAPTESEANEINKQYELATTGHNRIGSSVSTLGDDTDAASGVHGEIKEGEHVESGAPGAEKGFFDLASANPAHFSPENISRNWIPKHQLALDLARMSWKSRHPGETPAEIESGSRFSSRVSTAAFGAGTAAGRATAEKVTPVGTVHSDPALAPTPAGLVTAAPTASPAEQNEAQAWLTSAFADHFLTDAFASGHLISGSRGRDMCQTFFDTNASAITTACLACAIADGASLSDAAIIVQAIRAFTASRASSLLLKTVHDFYNRTGVEVRNALGQRWRTVGDAHLGGSPETIAMASLASKASRDAVRDVLSTGGTKRADAALDYVPDMARLDGGAFKPISAFSTDLEVWNPVLARALSQSPAVNDLYRMIRKNILPMASLKGHQAARAVQSTGAAAARGVQSTAGAARRWINQQVEDVERMPSQWHRDIERLYGVPY
jgi:hypothetical protein